MIIHKSDRPPTFSQSLKRQRPYISIHTPPGITGLLLHSFYNHFSLDIYVVNFKRIVTIRDLSIKKSSNQAFKVLQCIYVDGVEGGGGREE